MISQALARQLGLHVDSSVPIFIRTADNNRVKCCGTTWIGSKHPLSKRWIQIEFIVVKTAKVLIISNNDLKRLRLLEHNFPYFIGDVHNIPPSDNESKLSDEEPIYAVRPVHTKPKDTDCYRTQKMISQDTEYVTPEIHKQISQDTQCNASNTQYGPRIKQTLSNTIEVEINEEDPDSAEAEMAHEIFKCIGDEYIFAITDTEYLDDEGVDEHEVTQEEEKELINQKTELEQFFIHKYRDIFSESLSPFRFLQTKPMRILLSDTREMWNSRLYIHKPRPIPANIRKKARTLIDKLLKQGIIRRVGVDESSKYCAP